jgi:hypothetical protein
MAVTVDPSVSGEKGLKFRTQVDTCSKLIVRKLPELLEGLGIGEFGIDVSGLERFGPQDASTILAMTKKLITSHFVLVFIFRLRKIRMEKGGL